MMSQPCQFMYHCTELIMFNLCARFVVFLEVMSYLKESVPLKQNLRLCLQSVSLVLGFDEVRLGRSCS